MSEKKKRPNRPPRQPGQSFTVREFCDAERMGRTQLYGLWNQGIGPAYYWNGSSRRITEASRQEWHTQRIAEAKKASAAA
jgi:hypothetical protein